MKEKKLTFELSKLDAGQVIDGLSAQRDNWRNTQKYLDGQDVDCVIEECSDSEEAGWIANNYDRIINTIKEQINS